MKLRETCETSIHHSSAGVDRLARSLGIPRRQVEAEQWRLPDGSAADGIGKSVEEAAAWAADFVKQFGAFQQRVLPWMKPIKTP